MPSKQEQYMALKRALQKLHREDSQFSWRLTPPNYSESRDEHHWTLAEWPGGLFSQFGQHRRGPTSRH